jgi:hypothetical protein
MDAAIRNHGLEVEKSLNQAGHDIIPPDTAPSLACPPFLVKDGFTRWLPVLVLASSVATGVITDFDRLPKQLQRDQLSSARESAPRRQDPQISLHEARQRALQVLAETERNLHEERMAEARFIAALWDNDTQDI